MLLLSSEVVLSESGLLPGPSLDREQKEPREESVGRLRLGKEGSNGVGQVQSRVWRGCQETTLSIGLCACVHVCMGGG